MHMAKYGPFHFYARQLKYLPNTAVTSSEVRVIFDRWSKEMRARRPLVALITRLSLLCSVSEEAFQVVLSGIIGIHYVQNRENSEYDRADVLISDSSIE
jgi:hypothetical protein